MKVCNKKAQGKMCCLEYLHEGAHQDSTGFKFIDDKWPNRLGNGPSGYPMNNPGFDKAAKKVIEDRAEDYKRATEFLRKLRKSFE